MLLPGPALKVTLYLNQDTPGERGFLSDEILEFLRARDVPGATAFRALSGFGVHHRLHTRGAPDPEGLHLPLVIQFIEEPARFEALRADLLALVTDGLVEVQATDVLKHAATSPKVIS